MWTASPAYRCALRATWPALATVDTEPSSLEVPRALLLVFCSPVLLSPVGEESDVERDVGAVHAG
jgi:hypothetical protein